MLLCGRVRYQQLVPYCGGVSVPAEVLSELSACSFYRLGPKGSAICVFNATRSPPGQDNQGIFDIYGADYYSENGRPIANSQPFKVQCHLYCLFMCMCFDNGEQHNQFISVCVCVRV